MGNSFDPKNKYCEQRFIREGISQLSDDLLRSHMDFVDMMIGSGQDFAGITLQDMKSYKSKLITEFKKRGL